MLPVAGITKEGSMAREKDKRIMLRAFCIKNDKITQANSGLLDTLSEKLTESAANDRLMRLNPEDVKREEDLISDFNVNGHNFVSGVMLRLAHAEDVPNIPEEYLTREKIPLVELDSIEAGSSIIYKEHYYFLLDNDFVITNLLSNITITRFQTYINWLLKKERGPNFYEFTPMVVKQPGIKISEINKITVKDLSVASADEQAVGQKKFSLSLDSFTNLLSDVDSLDDMVKNNIISAELLIKFTKPRKMSDEDYQKIMGAYMKPISDSDNISFSTKRGGPKIKGSDVLKIKPVNVDLTETGKISEPHLYQEMEIFLREIKNEKRG
jgi:hypothetical protein